MSAVSSSLSCVRDASACQPRTEEHALGRAGLVQLDEKVGELFGLERGAAEIASRAEGTVETVPFAGGGEQGFQQEDVFSVGQLRGVNKGLILFLRREADGFG